MAEEPKTAPAVGSTGAAESGEIQVGEAGEAHPPTAEGQGSTSPVTDVQREIERAFERFFKGSWLRPSLWDFPSLRDTFEGKTPKVNVIDRESDIVLEAEMPGVDRADIEVSVRGASVVLKARTREETEEERGNYHRREIASGYYSRTVPLPCAADAESARARFENGLLTVTLEKLEGGPGRAVEVE